MKCKNLVLSAELLKVVCLCRGIEKLWFIYQMLFCNTMLFIPPDALFKDNDV